MNQEYKESIKSIVEEIHRVSNKSFEKLLTLLHIKTIPAKQVFIEVTHKDQSEYFILRGIIRGFVTTPKGEEVTLSYFNDKSIVSPFSARTQNSISTLNFQALTNTEVAYMNAFDFSKLRLNDSEIREFAQKVIEIELLKKTKKEIGLASLTAKERLLQFRKDYLGLENIIPHSHIASYLGITTVSLSRIRKELAGI